MRLERLLGLLSVLAENDKVTIRELADRFEVSRRTIMRDLDSLTYAGIPVTSCPGVNGGVSIMKGHRINQRVLSETDLEKLFTSLSSLKSFDGDTSITNLLAKLVPQMESGFYSDSNYVIDLSSWFLDSITQVKVSALLQSIRRHACIALEYISKNCRSRRIVEPHKLVFKQSYWYLYGFCRQSNDFRLFRLNRIVCYEMTDEKFEPRPVEKIEFDKTYGNGLFQSSKEEKSYDVVLRYSCADEYWLTKKIDASLFLRQPECDHGHIQLQVSDLEWALDFVLSLQGKVSVVNPPELREAVRQQLRKMIVSYENGDI